MVRFLIIKLWLYNYYVIPLFKFMQIWENIHIALYPWLSKYNKNIYLYRKFIFYGKLFSEKTYYRKTNNLPNFTAEPWRLNGTQYWAASSKTLPVLCKWYWNSTFLQPEVELLEIIYSINSYLLFTLPHCNISFSIIGFASAFLNTWRNGLQNPCPTPMSL